MAAMREGDILVHHPYDSFTTSVQRLIEQAVDDPNVLAIKLTVYRTSDDTPLVPALIRASERGKQAVCMVELKARFDEQANIALGAQAGGGGRARRLRPAGAQDARQVHPDRAPRGRRRAPLRARRDRQLPPEDRAPVHRLRPVHLRPGHRRRRRRHVQRPHRLRAPAPLPPGARRARPTCATGSSSEIERTIEAHQDGKHGADRDEDELARRRRVHPRAVRASQAGVPVDLNVRGICCLRPGVAGVSENIRVVSIVDRFLEHSRIYAFERDDECHVYIGSADLMPRNLDTRVELLAPVRDQALRDDAARHARALPRRRHERLGPAETTASGPAARRRARSPATCSAS